MFDDDPGEYAKRIMRSRACVRFALGCIEDLATPERIASVMALAIEGIYEDDDLAARGIAFGSGIARLKGSPVPCRAHFEWATA